MGGSGNAVADDVKVGNAVCVGGTVLITTGTKKVAVGVRLGGTSFGVSGGISVGISGVMLAEAPLSVQKPG